MAGKKTLTPGLKRASNSCARCRNSKDKCVRQVVDGVRMPCDRCVKRGVHCDVRPPTKKESADARTRRQASAQATQARIAAGDNTPIHHKRKLPVDSEELQVGTTEMPNGSKRIVGSDGSITFTRPFGAPPAVSEDSDAEPDEAPQPAAPAPALTAAATEASDPMTEVVTTSQHSQVPVHARPMAPLPRRHTLKHPETSAGQSYLTSTQPEDECELAKAQATREAFERFFAAANEIIAQTPNIMATVPTLASFDVDVSGLMNPETSFDKTQTYCDQDEIPCV